MSSGQCPGVLMQQPAADRLEQRALIHRHRDIEASQRLDHFRHGDFHARGQRALDTGQPDRLAIAGAISPLSTFPFDLIAGCPRQLEGK